MHIRHEIHDTSSSDNYCFLSIVKLMHIRIEFHDTSFSNETYLQCVVSMCIMLSLYAYTKLNLYLSESGGIIHVTVIVLL